MKGITREEAIAGAADVLVEAAYRIALEDAARESQHDAGVTGHAAAAACPRSET